MLKNMVKHFSLVWRHKWQVFKLCLRVGMPWRGLVHDLSKFSPTEFGESIKYYNGNTSPISVCKEKRGFSEAWLHHKGRNKHHPEYWYDVNTEEQNLVMPFKYACEMVCDQLAAGKVYQGKKWNKEYELKYFLERKDTFQCNEKIKNFLEEIYTQVAKKGIHEVVTKKNLRKTYDKYVNSNLSGQKC